MIELWNILTHLGGAVVFLLLSFFLIRRGWGKFWRVFSLFVFCFAAVFALSMSGVYHMLPHGGTAHTVLQRLDHAAIFTLIAGTFTPVHIILFRGLPRWGILLFIWAAAITAITLKSIFFSDVPEWLGLLLFLSLGWMGAVSAIMLLKKFGLKFIKPLLLGAAAYTLGAVCEFLRVPVIISGIIGPHEVFHVAVLFGLAYHWKFIYSFADGSPLAEESTIKAPK